MSVWQLELFGGVSLRNESSTLSDLVGKKAGALLALLALAPGRTRPREEVIDLLWPEVNYEEARVRFRQVLAQLRKLLEPAGVTPGSVLISDRTQVGIAQEHQSDVARFLQHLRGAAIHTEPAERIQHLRAALALYTGEFAPGFYVDALLIERERLAALAQGAREKLAALETTTTAPVIEESPRALPRSRTINRFFGREHERAQVRELLQSNRLVTLLGPGGTGKTRLTQELLADFPEAHFISLSTLRNGEDIADSVVSALALPDSHEPALTRLQAAFAGKSALLILDNVEQLINTGGAEAVAALLTALPTVSFLVTSRVTLDLSQEYVYRLGPLVKPVAIELFIDRARLANANFIPTEENQEAISELCRRLDGLPLAIELAAARSTVLSPGQILERLSRRFDLLADKRRDREDRHTSLRAALDWGWGLLAPDVQRFFTQLCVFRGSFSLEAIEVVTGESLAIDMLQSLVDASFLLVEPGESGQRFLLLETLREYGEEGLNRSDEELLFQRHSDFFLQCATRWHPLFRGAEFSAAIELFKKEIDNFDVAIHRSVKSSPERAIELCYYLSFYWDYTFSNQRGMYSLKQVFDAVDGIEIPDESRADLHATVGKVYRGTKYYENSYKHFLISDSIYRNILNVAEKNEQEEEFILNIKVKMASLLHKMAFSCLSRDEIDESERLFNEAMLINRLVDDEIQLVFNISGMTRAYARRACLAEDTDTYHELLQIGLNHIEEGVTLCRKHQHSFFLASMLGGKVLILLGLGRDREAEDLIAEGFPLALAQGEWRSLADFLDDYCYLAIKKQKWELAPQLLGAIDNIKKQWDIRYSNQVRKYIVDQQPLRAALPATLGQDRYNALYKAGFEASPEFLQALVATIH